MSNISIDVYNKVKKLMACITEIKKRLDSYFEM